METKVKPVKSAVKKDVLNENKGTENTDRRGFLSGASPGILSLAALAACGKIVNKERKPGDNAGGTAGGAGGSGGSGGRGDGDGQGAEDGNGNPDPYATGTPTPTASPDPDGTSTPSPTPTPANPHTYVENCMLYGDEEISLAPIGVSTSVVDSLIIYGNKNTRKHVMISSKLGADCPLGSVLNLVVKAQAADTSGVVLATKVISQNDIDFGLVIDGLNLVGKVEIVFVVVKPDGSKKKQTKGSAQSHFSSTFKEKPVIDVSGLVLETSAVQLAYGTNMPVQSWILDSSSGVKAVLNGVHTKVQTLTSRDIVVASGSSTWNDAYVPAIMKLSTTFVTDVLGNPIASTALTTMLRTHNSFVVYVPIDSQASKYFRYFFFVG